MKEIILHIGMHKTGSTSIQKSLAGYHDGTTAYASFSEVNHSVAISTIFCNRPHEYYYWVNRGLTEAEVSAKRGEYIETLEADLAQDADRLIISGEDIRWLNDEETTRLVRFFEDRGLVVRVICYLRSPSGYATSGTQEKIKGGHAVVGAMEIGYRNIIEIYTRLLPIDQITVRDFSDSIKEHGDIVSAFASELGLDQNHLNLRRANGSLSRSATILLYRLNKLPVAAFGSREHVLGRKRLLKALEDEFPRTDEDRLDETVLSGLVSPDIVTDIDYIKDTFNIDYGFEPSVDAVERAEAYLCDLSGIDRERVEQILRRHEAYHGRRDGIDEMLISLYSRLVNGAPLYHWDAESLRDIAMKIEKGGELGIEDALALMKLAKRARPWESLINRKVETYRKQLTSSPTDLRRSGTASEA